MVCTWPECVQKIEIKHSVCLKFVCVCMCMCTYVLDVCKCGCAYTVYVCAWMYVCVHVCLPVCVHMCMCVHPFLCVDLYVFLCNLYVCVHICMCVCVHISEGLTTTKVKNTENRDWERKLIVINKNHLTHYPQNIFKTPPTCTTINKKQQQNTIIKINHVTELKNN